jgi:hypothetical protein
MLNVHSHHGKWEIQSFLARQHQVHEWNLRLRDRVVLMVVWFSSAVLKHFELFFQEKVSYLIQSVWSTFYNPQVAVLEFLFWEWENRSEIQWQGCQKKDLAVNFFGVCTVDKCHSYNTAKQLKALLKVKHIFIMPFLFGMVTWTVVSKQCFEVWSREHVSTICVDKLTVYHGNIFFMPLTKLYTFLLGSNFTCCWLCK